MFCCPNCFSDDFLKKQIKAESSQLGNCDYCDTNNVEVIEPISLIDKFIPLFDLYNIDEDGNSLSECIHQDWKTFALNDPNLILDLLVEIMSDSKIRTNKYSPKIRYDRIKLDQWHEFREELKHQNRYFPRLIPDFDRLKNLFELLVLRTDLIPSELFRARINSKDTPFTIEEMGKPPNKIVLNGRANPVGISYLYAASDINTALSEVRPFKGDKVTIAKFDVMEPIPIVDLRNPRQTISPFAFEDDDLIEIYKDMPYLLMLGDELSKPFIPRTADLEYLPSQYLCEFVKHIGFEGIAYRSSLAKGDNFAIFEEYKLKPVDISEYTINDIILSYSKTISKRRLGAVRS